jgi:predicted Ser/Thr protein kinase
MDTTLARPPIGQLLDGRYRVESQIARGGMATVYLGTDTRLERTVALKIAHAELADDEDFVRRFIGEAKSVARLSSPHVVAVYDQGSDGDILFLAMEYVPGRTLRELLTARGRLSARESLDVIEGVLAGLQAAHQAGIVHRDVKPENVLITAGHAVKVADFGLARAAAGGGHTKTGTIIGTAAYLAPEQVTRGVSDARTDVYAAGVMLFELLTGTQPHTGGTPLAVAYKHVNEAVPAPSSIAPGLPPALDALVALATSRDPELRPADAGQFLRAISAVRHGLPIAGAYVTGRPGRPGGPVTPDIPGGPGIPGAGSALGASALGGTLVPDAPVLGGTPVPGGTVPGGTLVPDAPVLGGTPVPGGTVPGGTLVPDAPVLGGTPVLGGAAQVTEEPGSIPGAWSAPAASSFPDPAPPAGAWPAAASPPDPSSRPQEITSPGTSPSSWPGASTSPWPGASGSPWPGASGSPWPGASGSPWPDGSAPPWTDGSAASWTDASAADLPDGPRPAGSPQGHGEPRHGKPARSRSVEIVPAASAIRPADQQAGTMRV